MKLEISMELISNSNIDKKFKEELEKYLSERKEVKYKGANNGEY